MKKIVRNISDDSGKAFWASARKTAEPVEQWPAWKKGGIEVRQSGLVVSAAAISTPAVPDSKG